MKKTRFIIATLLVVMATAVAFVSCKKEKQDALLNNSQPVKTFSVPQIDDMNAYLKDFKHKMQTSKDEETLSLEEAAWHLSCLANIDFCRVNVEYDDFQFDTIEMQVNTRNGVILMSDLNMAYEQMCTEIQQFKKGFDHLDQNLYFIKVSIGTEGNAKIALMTSYFVNSKYLYNHQWYFQDVFEAIDVFYEYFSDDSTYVWNGLGATELQRVLNLFEHHDNGSIGNAIMCYIPTRDHIFDYTNTYDHYGSYYINDSRVYAVQYNYSCEDCIISIPELCYCLDSYLGLGYDYINDNLYANEHPVNWTVIPKSFNNYHNLTHTYYYYHQLYVEYGQLITPWPPTPDD